MLYLKKYFTEGLIQFTILLSLIGVRVDVDTYLSNQLPPLREIILGPSSAYTQTQFHNLRNTLDGYGIHPKSVDLDHFFTTRRLLNQVRQLDRLSVPSTELNTWLVHRDSETVVSASSQSSPSITLDNGAGLEDVNNLDATPAMRGGSGASETTYNLNAADSSLGAVAPEGNREGSRDGNDDLTKEVLVLPYVSAFSLLTHREPLIKKAANLVTNACCHLTCHTFLGPAGFVSKNCSNVKLAWTLGLSGNSNLVVNE